jgi:16S rRNA (cytosine1402-N4)-methyltransferase
MQGAQQTVHVPVLLTEALEALRAGGGGRFLDCTLGGGGHTRAILEANAVNEVVALDRDSAAVERAKSWSEQYGARLRIEHRPFGSIAELNAGSFDGLLADLGLSTDQLKGGRGFSFKDDESLDMRMDPSTGESAQELLNRLPERDLARIFREGGVGKESQMYARAVVRSRPVESASALAKLIADATPRHLQQPGFHPSTIVFQALRIAVNSEMEELEAFLDAVPSMIRSKGRLAVISFHSLEDKLVTRTLREWQSGGEFSARSPGSLQVKPKGRLLSKSAILPSDEEVARNSASRSARMRVFEFGDER